MDKISKLSAQEQQEYEKTQLEYDLWRDKNWQRQSEIHELPEWFDLEKYKPVKSFNLKQWIDALMIRIELQAIVSDGPVIRSDDPPQKFLSDLLINPLNPDFSIWPGFEETVEHYFEELNGWLATGERGGRNSFSYDLALPDHMLIAVFKGLLKEKRKFNGSLLRSKRVNHKQWSELNMLALVDLRLWGEKERKYLGWKLVSDLVDPTSDLDESVVRKRVQNFFDIYDDVKCLRFLITQWHLDKQ